MALRANEIVVAAIAAVTGLTTTGSNVFRALVYKLEKSSLPALLVIQGPDDADPIQNTAVIDSKLTVIIRPVVAQTTDYEVKLNDIRNEVHVAMMADRTLGKSYVIDVRPLGAGQPELLDGGETPVAFMDIQFDIYYRHSLTDASA